MLQYRPFCLARDIDDKAYVRRGTFEGFENSRNVRTITLTGRTKSRKLPKYDFPERLMYITPATQNFGERGVNCGRLGELLVRMTNILLLFTRRFCGQLWYNLG